MAMGLNVLEEARRAGTPKVVVAGTICAYPKFAPVPFREDDLWNGYPEETNAPYGIAKKALLVMAQAYRQEFGFELRDALPGEPLRPARQLRSRRLARDSGDDPQVRRGRDARRRDGRCCGATARRRASSSTSRRRARPRATPPSDTTTPEPVNLGAGFEISMRELAETDRRATRLRAARSRWDASRPNGQPRRMLDVSRARERFGFVAQHVARRRARADDRVVPREPARDPGARGQTVNDDLSMVYEREFSSDKAARAGAVSPSSSARELAAPRVQGRRSTIAIAEGRAHWSSRHRYYAEQVQRLVASLVRRAAACSRSAAAWAICWRRCRRAQGVGIDISPRMVELARERHPELDLRVVRRRARPAARGPVRRDHLSDAVGLLDDIRRARAAPAAARAERPHHRHVLQLRVGAGARARPSSSAARRRGPIRTGCRWPTSRTCCISSGYEVVRRGTDILHAGATCRCSRSSPTASLAKLPRAARVGAGRLLRGARRCPSRSRAAAERQRDLPVPQREGQHPRGRRAHADHGPGAPS